MANKIFARCAGILFFVVSGVILAACSATAEPAEVSVRLKWLHQTQFAGMYIAEQEGYYEDENLTVTIDSVDFEQQSAIEKVLAGENDFGLTSPEALLLARSEGKPVRAVAVIFKLNPTVYLVTPDSGIETPEDLLGEKVALSPEEPTILFIAMMKQLGLDLDQVEIVETTTFDLYECWELAPVCPNYSTNGPIILDQAGEEYNLIWPSDYGVTWYGDVLVTTEQMIEEQPEVVERFVRATLKGWQKAIEEPDLAVTTTLALDSQLDEEFQTEAMQRSIPLIDTGEAPIGVMSEEIWQNTLDILLDQEILSEPLDLEQVYTNEFAEGALE
ncbi:MAG: ABC transporter substrate-binding protein [Chloroflexi bacterium]|nr:ABC transporter substrate-binding protein [Chloroflexota bacterium]MCI0578322.1 ABC transporter substrate-binding protein [Chloroflexota bacterium]MCI0649010.1 ABC transporter substrate-binding protein [Chloroflexota bacterium]MCI0729445.1 ABC transporter substrate-binding protein [Chloroflexota bacterium]